MGRTPLALSGKQFNMLTVVPNSMVKKHGLMWWTVRCECGTETQMVATRIAKRYSCGCKRRPSDRRQPPKFSDEEVRVLYEACGSQSALAKHLGISRARANQLCIRAKVTVIPRFRKHLNLQQTRSDYLTKRRILRIAKGVCAQCGMEKQRPERKICDNCSSERREYQKRLRLRKKLSGACVKCDLPATGGTTLCDKHREANTKRTKHNYQLRKFMNKCSYFGCENPPKEGHVSCPEHLVVINERSKKYKKREL